jgi:hypothetical protein
VTVVQLVEDGDRPASGLMAPPVLVQQKLEPHLLDASVARILDQSERVAL